MTFVQKMHAFYIDEIDGKYFPHHLNAFSRADYGMINILYGI